MTGPRFQPDWFAAIFGTLFGLWYLVALVDYSPMQRGLFIPGDTTDPHQMAAENWAGRIGTDCAHLGVVWFGLAVWLVPAICLWGAWLALFHPRRLTVARFIAKVVAVVAATGLAAMVGFKSQYFSGGLGGGLGHFLYDDVLEKNIGVFGAATLLVCAYCAALTIVIVRDLGLTVERGLHNFNDWRQQRGHARAAAAEQAKQEPVQRKAAPVMVQGSGVFPTTVVTPSARPEPKPEPKTEPKAIPPPVFVPTPRLERPAPPPPAGKLELNIVKPKETKKGRGILPANSDSDYVPPGFDLLQEQAHPAEDSKDEHTRNMADLVRILGEFDVQVTPGEVILGPVITCYELTPAPGVRVEKIAGLDKNIALGMRAQSVRILAPIPGKAVVGVEIPNRQATQVGLREILESEEWEKTKADLPIALGKNVSGEPLISDLAKMPHLLIAGATGSGKSVCINAIIASILYSKSPKDVRLIMVDPKVVELKIFNTLPHMLIPVVTEPKKVPAALKILLKEMENRYQQFAKANVRNITGYNSRKKGTPPPPADTQAALAGVDPLAADDGLELPDRLPYIIAIIDELADLMMVAPAEIETSIARLAQLARAAGIHLIIATQRPSVNVITGVIKANLPSRIAFQVASQVDSRTILDGKGADTLIGRGDMLFSPPGTSRLVRAQGAFVSDEEVIRIVESLKKNNGLPQYDHSVQEQIDRAAAEAEAEETEDTEDNADLDDEALLKKALEVLRSTKRASTSMIQRRLRIGYNRAARLVDLMEERGIVGPENGSSPREILKDLDAM